MVRPNPPPPPTIPPGGGGSPPGGGGTPGGGVPGGGPGGWITSYEVSGKVWVRQFVVTGVPFVNQTCTWQDVDYSFTKPSNNPNWSQSSGGFTYYPQGSYPNGLTLPGKVKIEMKVKTKFTWTGSGTAPTELKAKLSGSSIASIAFAHSVGSTAVHNGLYHPVINSSGPMPGPYPGYYATSSQSSGDRYRKFATEGNLLQLETSLQALVEGTGQLSAQCQLTGTESQWAVAISSDRGQTYRRVEKNGQVKRVSNFFEDDEVTARGGDGRFYGDSAISEPNFWNGQDWDFVSTMTMHLSGDWSGSTSGAFSASSVPAGETSYVTWSSLLEFMFDRDWLRIGGDGLSPTPQEFTAMGQAQDPAFGIADQAVYEMKVHLAAEDKTSKGSFSGKLYEAQNVFSDDLVGHDPVPLWRADAPTQQTWNLNFINQITSTEGWETSADASIEFPIKMVDIHFGGKFTKSGSISINSSTGASTIVTIPAGSHLTFWSLPIGTVTRYSFSRWKQDGYLKDSDEFQLSGYVETIIPTTGPMYAVSVWP